MPLREEWLRRETHPFFRLLLTAADSSTLRFCDRLPPAVAALYSSAEAIPGYSADAPLPPLLARLAVPFAAAGAGSAPRLALTESTAVVPIGWSETRPFKVEPFPFPFACEWPWPFPFAWLWPLPLLWCAPAELPLAPIATADALVAWCCFFFVYCAGKDWSACRSSRVARTGVDARVRGLHRRRVPCRRRCPSGAGSSAAACAWACAAACLRRG